MTGKIDDTENDFLPRQPFENGTVETRLRCFDRHLRATALTELRKEGVARRPHVNDGRVTKADVHRRGADDVLERPIEGGHSKRARLLGPSLHVRLIDLYDIGAGVEEIADFLVHSGGIVHRCKFATSSVVVDLRLLRHCERPWHRHLDASLCVTAQELKIAHADRVAPADFSNHPGHGIRMTAAIQRHAGIVEVDTVEGGRKAVRIAFAADLSVGDDVEPRILLGFDGNERRVVLGFSQMRLGHPPQLPRTHPWRKAPGKAFAINQPVGLWIATDQRCWKQHRRPPRPSSCFRIPKRLSVFATIVDSDRRDRQVKGGAAGTSAYTCARLHRTRMRINPADRTCPEKTARATAHSAGKGRMRGAASTL